ncbi:MAG: 16S rRNA (guanine(966)-N(2))-methyltransferase RsmD [Microthrixaceae bacterium]
MRVIAGSAAGRRLEAPLGTGTRPTGDRVREATFNSLGSLGLVRDASVLDLFAGSGALGIEALSRGADCATFVERDARALRVIEANLAAVDLADRAEVVRGDSTGFLDATAGRWDLALLDPPYSWDGWGELWRRLPTDWAVAERDVEMSAPEGWELQRSRRYGGTWVTVLRRVGEADRTD